MQSHGNLQSNRVGFRVPAFGIREGELLLKASYDIASGDRVNIKLERASLVRPLPKLSLPLALTQWETYFSQLETFLSLPDLLGFDIPER